MPRDIHRFVPAFETLRFVAASCIGRTSRQTKRDFAGYAVGKRRKISVIPYIALDMAKEILRSVHVSERGQAVIPEARASKIEAILLDISDEEAFKLASIEPEERSELVDFIADQVRAMVLSNYTVTEIEREPEPSQAIESNGWKGHESIGLDERTRYKWRHTWAGDKGDDFVGYDGPICLGRIFRIDYTVQADKWFWLVEHVPQERLQRQCPSAGWEWSAREAACRVEKCYEAIMRLNGRKAA
ncbi:hypothetical protein PY650_23920 [Rhizobium calliandrae]|uniref:Uncharacterized protein n=1 Tax=Rhizobium calliandrae TaxID=1312182 RepID=A0ABT7KJA2_9HYPH|nr:hypothetical protein [Rhizobium calliandrae]MDL2408637.1 hypothetical protein [Rhizobium calliandrae]